MARESTNPRTSTPELLALCNYLRDGRCALFVGAGLSTAARLPDWRALMRRLAREVSRIQRSDSRALRTLMQRYQQDLVINRAQEILGAERVAQIVKPYPWARSRRALHRAVDAIVDELDLLARARVHALRRLIAAGKYPEVAEECRNLLGSGRLYDVLRQELVLDTVRLPLPHRLLVRLPFACVVTTNFDTLLEQAYARWGDRGVPRTPTGAELAQHGTLFVDRAFFVLKAHGDIDEPSSIVFAAEDYRRTIHASPAFQAFLSTLLLTHAVLFVGYSLSDPNFRLLLDAHLTTFGDNVPPRYALMSGVGDLEREVLWRTARIRVFSYPKGEHKHVSLFLRGLQRRVGTQASRPTRRARGAGRRRTPPRPPARQPISGGTLRVGLDGSRLDVMWENIPRRDRGRPSPREVDAPPTRASADASPLAPLLQAAEEVSRRPTQRRIAALGASLREALPATVMEALDAVPAGSLITLDPSVELEGIPWEWLRVGDALLCQRHAVVRCAPGISDKARGRPRAGAPLRALIIGDCAKPKRLHLPGARAEAKSVAALLRRSGPRTEVTLLLGKRATSRRVRQEISEGDYTIVHFTGHAWFDERESYIELYDGQIWGSELSYLINPRPPALLFLNSHYTSFVPPRMEPRYLAGRGAIDGDAWPRAPLRGFARLAALTGVGTFAGCFGSPTDHESMLLARKLYRELLAGVPAAEALRRARNSVSPLREWAPYLAARRGGGVLSESPGIAWQLGTPLLFSMSGYADLRLGE